MNRCTSPSPLEIHHVKPRRSRLGEGCRRTQRVVAVLTSAAEIPLGETYHLVSVEIEGRIDDHVGPPCPVDPCLEALFVPVEMFPAPGAETP
jgi:hypothetical protein